MEIFASPDQMRMNNDTGCSRSNGNASFTMYNPTVEKIKLQATQLYNEEQYHSAVDKYTLLIGLCPNEATFYSNRAACHMMLGDYVKALGDAKKSVQLNPTFIKGHCRVIKCAIILHKRIDIEISVAKLREIDPENEVIQYHAQKMRELSVHQQNEVNANASKDYVKALEHIEKYLAICPQFLDYKVKKAECLGNLRLFSEAEALSRAILREDPNNSDIHYVLGRCLYETDIETSIHHFQTAFRLDPDSGKDRQLYETGKTFLKKKMDANKAYKSRNFSQAYDLYYKLMLECIKNPGMLITLFFNMAQASYKLGNLDRCKQECTSVLNLKPNHLKALMRRAQCYMDQKESSKAIEDLETALGFESSAEILRMLQEARKLLEASKNDFYVILGVVRDATMEMITKAYKELTRVHHPDRHMNATNEEKKYHEMKCKEITRAYRLLMAQKLAKDGNKTNGTQGTNSAPKPPPSGSYNTHSNNNNSKPSSSGGTNQKFTGAQSSAGGTNTQRGQQYPSGGTNNNFSGPQSSAGASTSNGQQNQYGGTSTNFTNAQPSSGGSHHPNGQQYPAGAAYNNASGPQSSAGASSTPNGQQNQYGGTSTNFTNAQSSSGGSHYPSGQQYPAGATNNNCTGQQYSSGGTGHSFFSYPSGQQFPSAGTNNNSTVPQPSTGSSNNHNGQQVPAGSSNGPVIGQQFPLLYAMYSSVPFTSYNLFTQPNASGVPLVNPSGQQYSGGPSFHLNKNPPGACNNIGNVSQSSTKTCNSNKNHYNKQHSQGDWYDEDDDSDEDYDSDDWDDSDVEVYTYQKPWQRRQGKRYRPYHYKRYCHYCDWYIRGKYNCCPHCGFNPQ